MTGDIAAFAPGRVNLIGEHTDYAGGLSLPMAIHLGTTVTGVRGGDRIRLTSAQQDEAVDLPLTIDDPTTVEPAWGRYVAGVVAELSPTTGFVGEVSSTVPLGAGLSSSASLELAVALALGFHGMPRSLAELGQRAEQVASGVPCGLMDQLASACGTAGHALLVDFTTDEVRPVPVPADLEVVVVHSGQERRLAGSAYAERRASVEAAAAEIGALHDADLADVDRLTDPVLRRRARHVISEDARVRAFTTALAADDRPRLGELLLASHASLRDDFDVSTEVLDALVARLCAIPGVWGARLTGAGFGGCVVALTEPGTLGEGWVVRPGPGAFVSSS